MIKDILSPFMPECVKVDLLEKLNEDLSKHLGERFFGTIKSDGFLYVDEKKIHIGDGPGLPVKGLFNDVQQAKSFICENFNEFAKWIFETGEPTAPLKAISRLGRNVYGIKGILHAKDGMLVLLRNDGKILMREHRRGPIEPLSDSPWFKVSSGARMAIDFDGNLYRLGKTPSRCGAPVKFESIACGKHHSLAISHDKTLFGWGDNSCGKISERLPERVFRPVAIDCVHNWHWRRVAVSESMSAGIGENGVIRYWGNGKRGSWDGPFVSVSVYDNYVLGVKADGDLVVNGKTHSGNFKRVRENIIFDSDGRLYKWKHHSLVRTNIFASDAFENVIIKDGVIYEDCAL